MKSMDQKVAIVTGATSGIGASIAELLVAEGAHVVLAGRREPEGTEMATLLGERAGFFRTDVSNEEDVAALVGHTFERYGRLDVMVNNAGGPGDMSPATEYNLDTFERTMAVHVSGTLLGIKHAGRKMAAQASGSIINLGSAAGKAGGWAGLDYSVAKAAILQLTRSAAVDLGEHGVRVNSVSPGFVPTGIFAKGAGVPPSTADAAAALLGAKAPSLVQGVQPLATAVTPADVAAAVLWLAGDAGRLITGQDIGIDGGVSAGRPVTALRAERDRLRHALSS
ncbi:SDR family oxidoreductase [Streptomyces kunmingensis]|uniref:SDR family oxidoreductase n=1 Tax=Streptomyces kunmingensis TaxID=68225 RepID=A0ABU6C730_9ACTN|nr:SDR family oxidoreductase [Streptomyces kunmingensis]MEB3960489.1 SDR family oxidoreductase [Streptomyces kunmingensis]